jgi:hypothetical protein
MKNQYLVIHDLLSLGPIQFDGLEIDVTVDYVVEKYGKELSIDSSTYRHAPIYVNTDSGKQLRLDVNGATNKKFYEELEKELEKRALALAQETSDGWQTPDDD